MPSTPAPPPPPCLDVPSAPLSALQMQKYIDSCGEWLTDGGGGGGDADEQEEARALVPPLRLDEASSSSSRLTRQSGPCVRCGQTTSTKRTINPYCVAGRGFACCL